MAGPTSLPHARNSAVVGIDAGGTFTDVVAVVDGRLLSAKVESTPDDPARAVLAGLAAIGGLPPGGCLHHGTTVATNAVLTRRGARTALVLSEGFEDLLSIGRGHRLDLYALSPSRTRPLVSRERVIGLDERMGVDACSLRRPTASALARVVAAAKRSRAESVAVSLLHATANGAHEAAVARALRRAGFSVSESRLVSPEPREVERTETTVLDAFVGPKMRAYVARLATALPADSLRVLRSDGGLMSAADVSRSPVRTLLSGPAAGAAAAHALCRRLRIPRALAFDVGGTSTDVTWIEGEALPVSTDHSIAGFAMSVPSLDVRSVGAGGGSIVSLDAGGALAVGPASAGAVPGPACYGRGGPFTLTDAHILLGRLPASLAGGAVLLSKDAALRAARPLAKRAGLSVAALCRGAVAVAVATTARALKSVSAARGKDPRGAALIAFGGAGGLLAADVCAALALSEAVIPWSPGTFAAQGAVAAPPSADASRVISGRDGGSLPRIARELLREAEARLRASGEKPAHSRVEVDARYRGQAYELTVPFGPSWESEFHAAHALRHGFFDRAREVEAVRLRARVSARPLSFETPRRRESLPAGAVVVGPAVVAESGATTWVPRGAVLRAAPDGTLRLRWGKR